MAHHYDEGGAIWGPRTINSSIPAANQFPLESLVEVSNITPYGRHTAGYNFLVSVAGAVLDIPCFVNSNGVVYPEDKLSFSPTCARAIYHALVLAAPEGMYLLPVEEAIKPLLKEGA